MKEIKRFQCNNCKRILNREGTNSFPCNTCGHGRMRVVKPRAFCGQCKKPVYDNVDLRPDKRSKEGYYLICDDCTMALAQGVGITRGNKENERTM